MRSSGENPRLRKDQRRGQEPGKIRTRITRGSGNVFADLGFEAPEEELAKADLVVLIRARIKELSLTQSEAARRIGASQPKISKVMRGDISGITTGWLMSALINLGRSIEICVKQTRFRTGRLYVFSC